MQIHVLKDLKAKLVEPDNFRDFKVVAETAKDRLEEVGEALKAAGAGAVDAGHAWISEAWLRANKSGEAAWDEGFGKMLEFARSKGWVDDKGNIRAHIEWK
jgi:hypothetical protein